MNHTKVYFRREYAFLSIPKGRIIIGIVLSIAYSIIFYSLFILVREGVKLGITGSDDYLINSLWILPEKQERFSNLIIAFISTISGQNVCLEYFFDKPKRKFLSRYNYRMKMIINDSRTFTWYFLSWFTKLAVVYGIWIGSNWMFHYYSLYPEFNYIFILILVVFFLQQWNTLRRTLGNKALKWMAISAISISAISFSLSRLNIGDYKGLNEHFYSKSLIHNYRFNQPESSEYTWDYRWRSIREDIFLCYAKDNIDLNNFPTIIYQREPVDSAKLHIKLTEFKNELASWDLHRSRVVLNVDKSVPMRYVNDVKDILRKEHILNSGYTVKPVDDKWMNFPYYSYSVVKSILPEYFNNINDILNQVREVDYNIYFGKLPVYVGYRDGHYILNHKRYNKLEFERNMVYEMLYNFEYLIVLEDMDHLSFGEYIEFRNMITRLVRLTREQYCNKYYNKSYIQLPENDRTVIDDRFPKWVIEVPREIREEL